MLPADLYFTWQLLMSYVKIVMLPFTFSLNQISNLEIRYKSGYQFQTCRQSAAEVTSRLRLGKPPPFTTFAPGDSGV